MHRSRAYLAAILLLMLVFAAPVSAHALTSADAAAHANAAAAARKKAAEATALAEKLKAETDKLDDQVSALQTEADALDPQIAKASARTDRLRAELTSLRAQIAAKTASIEEATSQYVFEQKLLSERVNATYRQGEWFYVDMLLGSDDVRDLITRTELVSRVIRSNNDVAAQLSATRSGLEHSKAELDRTMQSVNLKKQEAQAAESELKKAQDSRQAKVDQQESILEQKSNLMVVSKKNATRLLAIAQAEEAESARIASMLPRTQGLRQVRAAAWHGRCPGTRASARRTATASTRSSRPRSFTRASISPAAASTAQPIVAAGAGTVIWAGARSGYGNVVMIDHGNGVVTLYAHQQSGGIKVSNGSTVKKGQRIGTVGSTGYLNGTPSPLRSPRERQPREPHELPLGVRRRGWRHPWGCHAQLRRRAARWAALRVCLSMASPGDASGSIPRCSPAWLARRRSLGC